MSKNRNVGDLDRAPVADGFNLEDYCANYRDSSLHTRLLFVAKNYPTLAKEAYTLLSSSLKASQNTKLYSEIFSNNKLTGSFGIEFDKDWVDETECSNLKQLERVKADMSTAKSSLVKEATRVACNDLGHLWCELGNTQEALKVFIRSRDFTSLPRHVEEMVLSVCTSAINLQRPHLLGNYLSKSLEESATSPAVASKLRSLTALLCLSQKDIAGAARAFASADSHFVGSFGEVMSAEDSVRGAVLCGLAALERGEIRELMLENVGFKGMLALVPGSREVLEQFLGGKYKEVREALGRNGDLRFRAEVDVHLSPFVDELFSGVMDRLVLQYFKPYSAVRMSRAVQVLYPTPSADNETSIETVTEAVKEMEEALEAIVWRLIEEGHLHGRIDAGGDESSIFRREERDSRGEALQSVVEGAQSSAVQMKHSLLRLSIVKHSFANTFNKMASAMHSSVAPPRHARRSRPHHFLEGGGGMGGHMEVEPEW